MHFIKPTEEIKNFRNLKTIWFFLLHITFTILFQIIYNVQIQYYYPLPETLSCGRKSRNMRQAFRPRKICPSEAQHFTIIHRTASKFYILSMNNKFS